MYKWEISLPLVEEKLIENRLRYPKNILPEVERPLEADDDDDSAWKSG